MASFKITLPAKVIIDGKKCRVSSIRAYLRDRNVENAESNRPAIDIELRRSESLERGDKDVWVNREAGVLYGEQAEYIREQAAWADAPRATVGDILEFENDGEKSYGIENDWNNNFRLVPV